ncbi:hypothetical protein J5N97_028913 [Dioscorea zingiberensis]|uniref:Uncharacterized protein n=1 Tax=Dioscorea zingiberensis TaxID=325984 RepID=A0A9D5BZT5_9LILI|nr:hypothetical protein J5N97_028913 [Dioscorea zingiberensis]
MRWSLGVGDGGECEQGSEGEAYHTKAPSAGGEAMGGEKKAVEMGRDAGEGFYSEGEGEEGDGGIIVK